MISYKLNKKTNKSILGSPLISGFLKDDDSHLPILKMHASESEGSWTLLRSDSECFEMARILVGSIYIGRSSNIYHLVMTNMAPWRKSP